MLVISDVLAVARDRTPDGRVLNLTEQRSEPLQEEAGKGPRATTIDVPKVLVELGAAKAKATVTFYLDPIDASRWLADTVLNGRRVRTVVVHGAAQVVEEITRARAAAGLPEPPRPGRPSSLRAFGGEGPLDIVTAEQGGR